MDKVRHGSDEEGKELPFAACIKCMQVLNPIKQHEQSRVPEQ